MDLTKLLLKQHARAKLAPCYIIRPPLMQPHLDLSRWAVDFLSSLLSQHSHVSLERGREKVKQGHPDILMISKESGKKSYQVENPGFAELMAWQNYRPRELDHQFIVVHEAQLIGTIMANKLLKVLEEPRGHQSIFLLCQDHRPMIKTIESRSITLHHPYHGPRPHPSPSEQIPSFIDSISHYFERKEKPLPEPVRQALQEGHHHIVIDFFSKNKEMVPLLVEALGQHHTHPRGTFRAKAAWQRELERFEQASLYHNYLPQRIFALIHCAQTNVL